MSILNIADLHLTSDPMDFYRWEFFSWLQTFVQSKKISTLNILGDLTEKKDRHSSELVNQLISHLIRLSEITNINVLLGNHDFISEGYPFFKFLNKIKNIRFITTFVHEKSVFKEHDIYYIPWGIPHVGDASVKKVYTHSNFVGVRFANGFPSEEGISTDMYPKATIISGHIHVPQTLNNLVMVGSPYPIDFGDDFQGRVLMEHDDGRIESFAYPSIRKLKWIIDTEVAVLREKLNPGDQLKLEILVAPDKFKEWPELKERIKIFYEEEGVIVRSITLIPKSIQPSLKAIKKESSHKDLIFDYGKKHNVPIEWILKGVELSK